MKLDVYFVDAFTDVLFKGNAAAVVPVEDWLGVAQMQSIAAENNLSETAYIKSLGKNRFAIRWFSPLTEIDFCGHATLASSFVLFNHLGVTGDIEFVTEKVGTLFVSQTSDQRIVMSFPNQKPQTVDDIPQALLAGLSVRPQRVLRNRQAYFAILENSQQVRSVQYRSEQLKKLAPYDVVVSASDVLEPSGSDFVSRYFWPANGGDEDPVTGSIHSGLAPYWAEQLNRTSLVAYQASKRGGVLYCEVHGDRVFVSGQAVLYMHGQIML